MVHFPKEIEHSEKYQDEVYEYKHVILTKEAFMSMQKDKLLSETEWRAMGINQTKGWIHFTIHKPEPHILLFRRPIGVNPKTGEITESIKEKIDSYEKKKSKFFDINNL
jgi:cyclin-dependent kinase regulatory subunit CKS1